MSGRSLGRGPVALRKGLRRARPARARRVCPVIRPRSRWAPSPAIKMLIGPGPPAAPRPGPSWEGAGTTGSALEGGWSRPRPHLGPRRLRLRDKGAAAPRPGPSGTPATQDGYAAAAAARATKRACGLRRAPRAGPARSHPHLLACGAEPREEAGRSAQPSRHAPARALPGRPARRALPAGARGPAAPPCTRSLRVAAGARAPPPCTRSRLGRARTLPGATLRPWSSVTAGRAEARSERGLPSHPAQAREGTMAAPGPN